MERRERILLALGAAGALGVAGLAVGFGGGSVDAPSPAPPLSGNGSAPAAIRRNLPAPRIGPGVPGPAAELLRSAWVRVESGSPEEARAALGTLTPLGAGSPLLPCAPAALEALAPGLEALITGEDPSLAAAAMRCAAFLARAGGPAGREALARTRLVVKGFGLHASAGSPALRVETARLLGFAGGAEAVDWLVILLRKATEPEVKEAAVEGLAEAFGPDGGYTLEAVLAVKDAAGPGSPPALRAACMRTLAKAWKAFAPYDVGPVAAAALGDPDRSLRMAAAGFFAAHPLDAQAGDLVKALAAERDPDILGALCDALEILKPPGAREAAEGRRRSVADPGALKALERLLRALGPAPER